MKNGIIDRQLKLKLVSGKADYPKINAIVLVKGAPSSTHIDNYNKYIEELFRIATETEEMTIKENVKNASKALYNTRDNYFADEDIFDIPRPYSVNNFFLCCKYQSLLMSCCFLMLFFYYISFLKEK